MIGIYGGTFDPVHYGHLRTALEVKEKFLLDEVRLIPCAQPAHKALPLTLPEMRLAMLELAVKNQPGLVIDRRELVRDGYSYMIDTLKSLRSETPRQSLLLFIGTDAFKGLADWYQWQQLFDYAHIVVITRPGYQLKQIPDFLSSKLTEDREKLIRDRLGYLFFQSVTQLDISATAIRATIEAGLNPGFLLPDNVINYIKNNKLYLT
ncbi:MAG: nicotinate-nucleotide adenylyltransferase [Methylococcales bacterium]|nr:nicotinate-nucleotide adenylyltransferase [Methylococcales bacterium]